MRKIRILFFYDGHVKMSRRLAYRWIASLVMSRLLKSFKKSCTDVEGVVQSAHFPGPCRSGGTGRRKGLKIPRLERAVPVQVRAPAPIKSTTYISSTSFYNKPNHLGFTTLVTLLVPPSTSKHSPFPSKTSDPRLMAEAM